MENKDRRSPRAFVGCAKEFGLHYKSNGKPQAGLKQRNATYCVLERSPQLHGADVWKKMLPVAKQKCCGIDNRLVMASNVVPWK